LEAYTYENNLNDLDKAKALYEKFLTDFPKSAFADDAKFSIQNLGLTPEQIIEKFKK
jgi:TolA-binding protein